MTHPRRLLRGQTLLITRRCARRCFFFKPTARARSIMAYCLTRAASQYSIQIHAFLFHVNHLHFVLTDPHAELPEFMHCLGTNLARAMNAHLGRGENFFAPGSYSKVELATRAAVLEELVYVLTNVVKDGIVSRPEKWPGLRSLADDVGTLTFQAERPDFFFQSKGSAQRPVLPEAASFEVTTPPCFDDITPDAFRELLNERVEVEINAIKASRRAQGKKRFMGVRAVMAQDPRDAAGDVFPKRKLNPTIACGKGREELRVQLLSLLTAWREEYRAMWERWREGERDVEFPAGAYAMRVKYFVKTGTSPPLLFAA